MLLKRKNSIRDMLARLTHRQALIGQKCVEGLMEESHLAEEVAKPLAAQWLNLVMALLEHDEAVLADQARALGGEWAAQAIPFEAVMAQLHYYKRATMPILVREYQGLEGYLDAHLALDELLTWLMGKIPLGYFSANHQTPQG